jgi:hypothetical protein
MLGKILRWVDYAGAFFDRILEKEIDKNTYLLTPSKTKLVSLYFIGLILCYFSDRSDLYTLVLH